MSRNITQRQHNCFIKVSKILSFSRSSIARVSVQLLAERPLYTPSGHVYVEICDHKSWCGDCDIGLLSSSPSAAED